MAKNAEYEEEEEEEVEAEDSSDGDDDDEEGEEVLQKEPRPNAVYNSVALHEKLEEIGWPEGLDWMHTLCVDYHVEDGEIDVEDDLAREMAFYTQALEGTREAFTTKLLPAGTPFLRPPDYYAEMVKSDAHMLKVKDNLLSQKKQMEETEERRKAREAKRFSKEVQAQKLKQRAQEKKHNIESVKKWRKMRQDQGFDGGEESFPVNFDDGTDGARGSKKRSRESSKKFKGSADDEFPLDFDNDDGGLKKRRRQDGHTAGPFKKFKGSGGNTTSKNPGREKFNRNSFAAKDRGHKSPLLGSSEKGKQSNRSAFGNAERGSRSPGPHKKNPNAGSGIRSPGSHRSPNAAPWDRSGGKGSSGKAGKGKSFQKRQSRDAKYGHGGRKSFKKANTAESSAGFFGSKKKKGKL